jgi:hypothetical protein
MWKWKGGRERSQWEREDMKEESCGSETGEGEESVGRIGKNDESCGRGRGEGEESVGRVGKKEESCGSGRGEGQSQREEWKEREGMWEWKGGGRGVSGKS